MLSLKTILSTTSQYSSRCVRKKTFYPLYLRNPETIEKRLAHTVPDKYLIEERDIKKYKLPPQVKALKKYLVYSEYVESKKLRKGHKANKKIIGTLQARARAKKMMDDCAPVYSSMLGLLDDAKTEVTQQSRECAAKDEEDEDEEPETVKKIPKPIHMPYAATDSYREVPVTKTEPEYKPSDINENYKKIYEDYLKEKESDETLNMPESLGSSDEFIGKRPVESTEKIPPNWMTDYEQYEDSFDKDESSESNYGTPDMDIPVSSIPCGGCGALLHCKDSAIPGYLPSELFVDQKDEILKSTVCQRCHFMKNYNTSLEVKVSAEEYPVLLGHLKKKKVAVILMVDLTDFPCSIWPGIMDIIGKTTNVYVVGNKVDLLPNDGKHFFKNVEESLLQSLNDMGIGKANIKGVNLISAKTGYGVERLINTLHKNWANKGDVYVIGSTNVGKSSLFNALLGSDYCQIQAADLIQRATISPWPGTTLNLLKFPITSPSRWRLYMRFQRLVSERQIEAEEKQLRDDKYRESKKIRYATLQGRIGKSFVSSIREEGPGFFGQNLAPNDSGYLGINDKGKPYESARWFYDTPGAIHPDQVLHYLTTEELMMTLPRKMILPRTFDVPRGHTLFLAGLGRLDFVKGAFYTKFTVFASSDLPVTMCMTKNADELYEKLLLTEAFAVPINDPERLKVFPALESKEFTVNGIPEKESAADIVLSSAGWVAVSVKENTTAILKAWTPEGRGIYLRTPSMLSRSVNFRGKKVPYTPAYSRGQQVYFKNN